jgi:hypothetical protein
MRVSSLDVIRELKEQRKLERAAQKEQKNHLSKDADTCGSGWVWDTDIVRRAKEQRKRDREAEREQDKLNRELTKKARVSVARKITAFDAKTLSQKEAATLLDCVIGQWQRGK